MDYFHSHYPDRNTAQRRHAVSCHEIHDPWCVTDRHSRDHERREPVVVVRESEEDNRLAALLKDPSIKMLMLDDWVLGSKLFSMSPQMLKGLAIQIGKKGKAAREARQALGVVENKPVARSRAADDDEEDCCTTDAKSEADNHFLVQAPLMLMVQNGWRTLSVAFTSFGRKVTDRMSHRVRALRSQISGSEIAPVTEKLVPRAAAPSVIASI